MKFCRKCKEELILGENYFAKPHTKYRGNCCQECAKADDRKRRAETIEERAAYNKNYHTRNKEILNAVSRAYYQENKERLTVYNSNAYQENRTERVMQAREYRKTKADQVKLARYLMKKEVISHYSNGAMQCALCDETRLPALSIDHLDGGGHKHRQEIKRRGTAFYRWLKQNNFPAGFRILCMSCQFVERNRLYGWGEENANCCSS